MLSIWGVAQHDYRSENTSTFEAAMIEVLAPIQRGTLSLKETIATTVDHYFMIVNTSKENETLRSTVQNLENEIFSLSEVSKENERLKQLLDFGKEIPRKKVLAQVVGWDPSDEFKVLRINKGSDQGLALMSPVITSNGLVGYVYRLTPNYSDILTILDPNNRVDAISVRTRTHGIVEGKSGFICNFKYISRTENAEIGDEVISAGLGEIYPKGIKVGTITKVDKESYGITQRIELTPSVNFQKLEEVVVLIKEKE